MKNATLSISKDDFFKSCGSEVNSKNRLSDMFSEDFLKNQTPSFNKKIVFLSDAFISKNNLIENIKQSYLNQKNKYPSYVAGFENKTEKILENIIDNIFLLKIKQIDLFITDSPSFFFKFVENEQQFSFEVFFDHTDIIEMSYFVRKNSVLKSSNFGCFDDMFDELSIILRNSSIYDLIDSSCLHFDKNIAYSN